MSKYLTFSFLLTFSVATWSQSQEPVMIQNGFISGNQYKAMSSDERTSYIMGIIDGLFLSPFLKAPSSEVKKLSNCLSGMQNIQVRAIAEKKLDASPERWHQSMHSIVWGSLNEACFKNS